MVLAYQLPSHNPKNYGLPKIHKSDIPLRPIISGKGSAPHHDIAKLLAKILSLLLGTIRDAHIKNSGSFLNKLIDIDRNNKSFASLDIKSLFTYIHINRCIERLR